jgi:8-oxo-dGTP diphosphatase
MPELTRVVAKVIVFDEKNNVLLIRRSKNDVRRPLEWDVPGGMVEPGEVYIDAAIRETKEEVGFDLKAGNTHVVYATCDITEHGNVLWIYYVARVTNAVPTLSHEHDGYQWVNIEQALEILTYVRQNNALSYISSNNLLPPQA